MAAGESRVSHDVGDRDDNFPSRFTSFLAERNVTATVEVLLRVSCACAYMGARNNLIMHEWNLP